MRGILGFSGNYSKPAKTQQSMTKQFSKRFQDALAMLSHRGPDASGVENAMGSQDFHGPYEAGNTRFVFCGFSANDIAKR